MVKIVQLCPGAPLSKLAQVCVLHVKTWHDSFIQLSSLSGILCRRIWFTKEVQEFRTGTTASWVMEGFVEHNCINTFLGKKKSIFGRFWSSFFSTFFVTI
jgi:hypothetical protein